MTDAFIYCRISSDPTGRRAGVERQRTDCEAYATAHNLNVLRIYEDNDISAYSGDRVAYRDMCQQLDDGAAQAVIVWDTDRLYRRSRDLEPLIQLIERTGVTIHTVNGGTLDFATSGGRMQARIQATVATHEVEHTAERVKASHRHLREQGQWTGGIPPLGYRKGGDAGIEPDPERAPLVQQAAREVLDGRALFSVAKRFTEAGHTTPKGNPITARALRRALSTPTVAGIVTHDGKEIGPAAWPALIPERDYRTIQDIFSDPSRRTAQSNERKWQGAGVYRCGNCGSVLYTGKTTRGRRTYQCRECLKIGRDQQRVDEVVTTAVCAYLSQQRVEPRLEDDDSTALSSERDRLTLKLSTLTRMFTDDLIGEKQLADGTREINEKVTRIDRELAHIREHDPMADLIMSGEGLRGRWDQLSPDSRARIIDTLMTVTILPAQRRGPVFDPRGVQIEWKTAPV